MAATPDAVVLLDGAGTPAGSESGCIHGVTWFVRQLGSALLSSLMGSDDSDPAGCLAASIAAVRSLHADTCDLSHPGSPSATVVALRERKSIIQYAVLADSVLLLSLSDGLRVVTDAREVQVGKQFRTEMDATPNGTPDHDKALRNYIEKLRAHRNRPGGFGVASAEPDAAAEALTGTVPCHQLRAAALLSDGASRLVDRFGLVTWDDALRTLATAGPSELLRQVRAAENGDLEGSRWPRGKVHDDATAAYCVDCALSALTHHESALADCVKHQPRSTSEVSAKTDNTSLP